LLLGSVQKSPRCSRGCLIFRRHAKHQRHLRWYYNRVNLCALCWAFKTVPDGLRLRSGGFQLPVRQPQTSQHSLTVLSKPSISTCVVVGPSEIRWVERAAVSSWTVAKTA